MKHLIKTIGMILLVTVILLILFLIIGVIRNKLNETKVWLPDDYDRIFVSESETERKFAGRGVCEVGELEFDSDNKAIRKIRVWYPTEAAEDNRTYPIIVFVNASNVAALNLKPAFSRLASWGFIVVGNDDRQTGTGESASETLDFILGLNADQNCVLYGKMDVEHIGCIGYSQGGAGAINAVTKYENSRKFTTLFTGSASYALLSENMGWGYDISKISVPYFMTAGTGNSDDAGNAEIHNKETFAGVAPLASLIENYNGITDDIFKIRARITGAEHEDMLTKSDGYMTAWMLWQLQGNEDAACVFLGDTAEILSNNGWQDIEKNG